MKYPFSQYLVDVLTPEAFEETACVLNKNYLAISDVTDIDWDSSDENNRDFFFYGPEPDVYAWVSRQEFSKETGELLDDIILELYKETMDEYEENNKNNKNKAQKE